MQRQCRNILLSNSPLVLVLAQVRFSPIKKIADYIPVIQEDLRRHDFPLFKEDVVRQVSLGPRGPEIRERPQWLFQDREEQWTMLLNEDGLVLQTTAYDRFEGFAIKLEKTLATTLSSTEHDQFGVIQRIGLRYIDVVEPKAGQDFRHYLQPGFHGATDAAFIDGNRLHLENRGQTMVDDMRGTMVIRIMQNDGGYLLPPDLMPGVHTHSAKTAPGKLRTLIDMDHYIESNLDPKTSLVLERAYTMHDHLIETFYDSVVTKEACEVWQ